MTELGINVQLMGLVVTGFAVSWFGSIVVSAVRWMVRQTGSQTGAEFRD